MRFRTRLALFPFVVLGGSPALGQGSPFRSPGQSPYNALGQTTRFSNELNPAIGFAIDGFADFLDVEAGDDGFDLRFRLLELNASAFIDPNAWAYVSVVSEGGESLEVEEAALEYVGFESKATIRAGRFFVDFGKQMQSHLEELRTLERPLVLREYLGEELSGTGGQLDTWFAAGEETPVRFSLGVFASLLGEGHEDGNGAGEPDAFVPDRKDVDELSVTARLTGMTDVGESGQLQLGGSVRHVPEFSFEDGENGLSASGLSNSVYGLDASYGRTDETGTRVFTMGAEALLIDGDLAAEVDAMTPALTVVDDEAFGFYGFVDYAWNRSDSAGVQVSFAELVEDPSEDAMELDLYYTRHFTELRRARVGVTVGEEEDEEFLRVYLQITAFFGSHAHGINW